MASEKKENLIFFSDVHGNFEALEASLEVIHAHKDPYIISLGDIVGYGANPKECLAEIRTMAKVSLAGNHDYAAIGLTDIERFNPYAKKAAIWTSQQLDDEEKSYLTGLPLKKQIEGLFFLTHSTPIHPERWKYIITLEDSRAFFPCFDEQICFVGHSHIPLVAEKTGHGALRVLDHHSPIQLDPESRYIVNVGSIGQPRDGDCRACLVIYDQHERIIEFKRIAYDLARAKEKIIHAGLPAFLAERLQYGI